ncbi:MarR family transcriptional regulator [Amnibacterium flavum]|uniref:MarR family transcriptional regulator n=1 Tax=Amnibacterium flavum TaxID=2173173 RepID=A0A2V1HXB5_9MICO|nr:MarR family transcriptional regulator [Amnibacterium flavum]
MVKLSADFERRLGRTLAVNHTDLVAMQHLMESGPLSPSELSSRLRISTAAATMVVDRLEAVGHVSRQPHPEDRRKIVVVPREDSVRLAAQELLPLVGGVAQAIADLPAEDAAVIERFLGEVVEHYRAALDG